MVKEMVEVIIFFFSSGKGNSAISDCEQREVFITKGSDPSSSVFPSYISGVHLSCSSSSVFPTLPLGSPFFFFFFCLP